MLNGSFSMERRVKDGKGAISLYNDPADAVLYGMNYCNVLDEAVSKGLHGQ